MRRLKMPLWLAITMGMTIGALTTVTIWNYRLGGFDDLLASVLLSLWSAESLAGLITGAFLGSFCWMLLNVQHRFTRVEYGAMAPIGAAVAGILDYLRRRNAELRTANPEP